MSERSPAEIRASIEANRVELAVSIERLRGEVAQLADWRSHLRRHRTAALVGAAFAGFVIGGGVAAVGGLLLGRRG
jgi:hypothetical protein